MAEIVAKMKKAVSVASESAEEGRKRKVDSGGELNYATSLVQLGISRSRRRRVDNFAKPENSAENAAACNSDDPCASCCSSNGSSELEIKDSSEFIDLEVEEDEEGSVEISTSTTYELENCCTERRETTPSSEAQAESGELEESMMSSEANSSRRRPTVDDQEKKMPSEAELEEFFSAAEKNLQQKFEQQYNFDVVKEEPLEGRYEWVRIKP